MSDDTKPVLPLNYRGLRILQKEFDRYQRRAFVDRPSRFFSLELCGEAGELANFEKKAWKGRTVTEQDFAEEAADVAIALLNYANSKQIDLASEMEKKMSKIDAQRIDEQKDR